MKTKRNFFVQFLVNAASFAAYIIALIFTKNAGLATALHH